MFTNNVFFYAAAGAAIVGAFAWWAHDLKERGRIEAINEINRQAQKIETEQKQKQIESLNAAFAIADAAMTTRSKAYEVANETAQKLQNDAEKGNGRGEKRGNLEPNRNNAGGMFCDCSGSGSDSVRVSANKDSDRAKRAENGACTGRHGADIGRDTRLKLIKLAQDCDKVTADYNALLQICEN